MNTANNSTYQNVSENEMNYENDKRNYRLNKALKDYSFSGMSDYRNNSSFGYRDSGYLEDFLRKNKGSGNYKELDCAQMISPASFPVIKLRGLS